MAKKQALREETPVEELAKIAVDAPEVQVRLSRVQAGSRRMSLGWRMWPTVDISGPKFEDWIKEEFGGGVYIVDIFDPNDGAHRLIPAFRLSFPGDPKPTAAQQVRHERQTTLNAQRGLPPPSMDQFMRTTSGLPPMRAEGTDYGISARTAEALDPRRYWNSTPDAAFKAQADQLSVRLDTMEKKNEVERKDHDQERRRWEDKERGWVQQAADLRETHRKEQQVVERQSWEKEMATLAQQAQQKPSMDIAATLTAVAPIIAAYMQTSKERDSLAQAQQFKNLEAQQKGTDNLLKLMGNRSSSETETLKALMPMVTKAMDEKSPAKQATLITAMGDQQATMLSLVHQVIQANQPENPPPWLDFATTAVGNLAEVARTFAASQHGGEQQPATPPVSSLIQVPQAESQAQQIAEAMLTHANWPEDMRTPEWRQLVVLVHEQHDSVELAATLFSHFDNLDRLGLVPIVFNGIWEEPERVLTDWLKLLPISQMNAEYVQELAAHFATAVQADVPVADSTTTVVTPVPTNGAPVEEAVGEVVMAESVNLPHEEKA